MDEPEPEDTSPLQDATAQQHEIFIAYMKSGFSEQQAMYIVAAIASGGPRPIG
jgi:hypothetical protein